MFVWLGLILTLLIWAGLALLLTRWHNRQLGSISAHGSSSASAAWLFRSILVGGGLLLYWWLLGWYIPHLKLPLIFTVILSVVVLYQILTGLINTRAGWGKELHDYTAQTMSLLYIPLSVLILESPQLSLTARIITICLTVFLVNNYVLVEVLKKFRDTRLIYQLLHIVAFQLAILASAYLS